MKIISELAQILALWALINGGFYLIIQLIKKLNKQNTNGSSIK